MLASESKPVPSRRGLFALSFTHVAHKIGQRLSISHYLFKAFSKLKRLECRLRTLDFFCGGQDGSIGTFYSAFRELNDI